MKQENCFRTAEGAERREEEPQMKTDEHGSIQDNGFASAFICVDLWFQLSSLRLCALCGALSMTLSSQCGSAITIKHP
jgi:hypothetical protein